MAPLRKQIVQDGWQWPGCRIAWAVRAHYSSPKGMTMNLNKVSEAIAAIAAGQLVVVVDDDDRENEGDLIMAASKATPEQVAFMIRHTSGIICAPIGQDSAEHLNLEPMVATNRDPKRTAFTVSVDYRVGLTTGISAEGGANTLNALAHGNFIG